MRIRFRSCLTLSAALLALAAAPLALAQPAAAPAKKDKEPAKKQELPKPPPPKPASEITLKVGDKAPTFKPDVWVKPIPAALPPVSAAPPAPPAPAAPSSSESAPPAGSAPETLTFDPTKVYVVEFWATWCASCREAMPTMAKLARANKDLVIVAVASSERKPAKDAPDQRLEGVRRHVGENAEKMPFAVVFDGSRTIANSWIAAAGRVWIPTAFIVDNTGTITFIGDPRDKAFDTALTKALKALPQPKPPEPVTPDPKKKTTKPRSKG